MKNYPHELQNFMVIFPFICFFGCLVFLVNTINEYKCNKTAKMLNYTNPEYNVFVGCVIENNKKEKVLLQKLRFEQ